MLKMIQKDYDLKGVEFLKILGFLVLSLFIITGCSPNDEKETAETVTEVSTSVAESEIKEKEIETRSISEHFTKDLTDEVWIEINLDSNGQVSQNSQVSSFLVTNDTSHESDLYKGFSIYNPDEKGYVYINISDGQLFNSGDFKTKLRVGCEEYFDRYFSYNLNPQELPEFVIEKIIREDKKFELFEAEIKEILSKYDHYQVISKFFIYMDILEKNDKVIMLKYFLKIYKKFFEYLKKNKAKNFVVFMILTSCENISQKL